MKKIKIGMFGLGTVGTGVVRLLKENGEMILERCRTEFEIKTIVVKNLKKKRVIKTKSFITDQPQTILNDQEIDVILELIGDKVLTKKIFHHCAKNKIPLITANKAFLAEESRFLKNLSLPFLGFDASVAGSIPILKTMKYGLSSNEISSMIGIINGTANFILSNMEKERTVFPEELKKAQELGYAETDPTFDIKGNDTAHKLLILMGMAWNRCFNYSDLYVEGIDKIELMDIIYANEFGYKIKLLGITKKIEASKNSSKESIYEARVHPALVPMNSMLASVSGSYNGVYLEGNYAGPYMAYGQGAGSHPTASAVVSDLMLLTEFSSKKSDLYFFNYPLGRVKHIELIEIDYFLIFRVNDQTGVLAEITRLLVKNHISIFKMVQKENLNFKSLKKKSNNVVDLIMVTHQSLEKNILRALSEIDRKKFVVRKTKWIRIEKEIH